MKRIALRVRPAKIDDVDAITDVVCTAMPQDPQWDYRMPWRKIHPEDTRRCTRREYENILKPGGEQNHLVNVIEAPADEDRSKQKIIAVAVWDITFVHYALPEGMLSRHQLFCCFAVPLGF